MSTELGFESEAALMRAALASSLWRRFELYANSANAIFVEPKGLFGEPDLVLANVKRLANQLEKIRVFAFELKLRNWRRALAQAFRYRTFANRSYVVIDARFVKPPLANIAEFQRANVGLLSFSVTGRIRSHFEPQYGRPYSDRLTLAFKAGTSMALNSSEQTSQTGGLSRVDGFRFRRTLNSAKRNSPTSVT